MTDLSNVAKSNTAETAINLFRTTFEITYLNIELHKNVHYI